MGGCMHSVVGHTPDAVDVMASSAFPRVYLDVAVLPPAGNERTPAVIGLAVEDRH